MASRTSYRSTVSSFQKYIDSQKCLLRLSQDLNPTTFFSSCASTSADRIVVGKIYNNEEARAQDYTIAVEATFASKEDVKYYDTECEGHKALKAVATPRHTGVLTALFESNQP